MIQSPQYKEKNPRWLLIMISSHVSMKEQQF